jgi:hypothetical protein
MVEQPVDALLRTAALAIAERRVADLIARNAWRHVDELQHRGHEPGEAARFAVQRVVAEAGAYPPTAALRVHVESSAPEARTETGIWSDEGMAIVLCWTNRADFSIQLEHVTGSIVISDVDTDHTFTLDAPAFFEIAPRSECKLALVAVSDRKWPPPRYSQPSVAGEVQIDALVMGPWPDASHRYQRFSAGRGWFPVSAALVGR